MAESMYVTLQDAAGQEVLTMTPSKESPLREVQVDGLVCAIETNRDPEQEQERLTVARW